MADRIYIFDQGRVIAQGTLNELIHSLKMDSIITFEINSNGNFDEVKEELFKDANFQVTKSENFYTIETKDVEGALVKIFEDAKIQKFDISNIVVRKPNLEDVFLHLTGKSLRD